jgi:nitrite reductase (NO-forming)
MAKGLVIIIALMAIGAGVHFAFSDTWNAYKPLNQLVAVKEPTVGVVTPTGVTREFTLTFKESADLRTLGFNAVAGEEGANPDIVVDVGDKVVIKAVNGGVMPHAFGVVSDPENPSSVIFNARVKSADNPLLRGEDGTVEFMPNKAGEYYYICTVPGHSALGMQGKFIVKAAEGGSAGAAPKVEPTGMTDTFDLSFTETADLRTLGFNAPRGEPGSNPEIRVKAGNTVVINVANNGKMPHAFGVVSDPENPNSVVFNSGIKSADNPFLRGQSGSVEFVADRPGHYYYICTVPGHPAQGMQGDFIVE